MGPSYNHSYLQAKLSNLLFNFEDYLVLSELTLEIDNKDYIPDVVLYPKRPIDWLNDTIKMTEMPLLAIEILSPTQSTQEVIDKFKIYFQSGVKSCWLVQPIANIVMVFSGPDQAKTFAQNKVVDEVLNLTLAINDIFL